MEMARAISMKKVSLQNLFDRVLPGTLRRVYLRCTPHQRKRAGEAGAASDGGGMRRKSGVVRMLRCCHGPLQEANLEAATKSWGVGLSRGRRASVLRYPAGLPGTSVGL